MASSSDNSEVLRQGIKAFKQGQYLEALPLLKSCAEGGSLEAQKLLSRMYYAGGHGLQADEEQYLYWLARAGENGDPAARAKIRRRYRAGNLPENLLNNTVLRHLLRKQP